VINAVFIENRHVINPNNFVATGSDAAAWRGATSGNVRPLIVPPMDAGNGHNGNGHHVEQPLRMYTEEQVAEILQVSLSQLRIRPLSVRISI
jgi:hypothetical protein